MNTLGLVTGSILVGTAMVTAPVLGVYTMPILAIGCLVIGLSLDGWA